VSTYDYIIVGAGTAGCVVAARLAEDPSVSVALLEAGGPYRRVLDVPLVGLWAWLRRPRSFCWQDWTIAQPALEGRRIWWPAGRMLGGSSSINAMMYNRGAKASYDRWRDGSEIEWSGDALLPYFERGEDQERGPSAHHGVGGPIGVSDGRHISELGRAFVAGCEEAGIPSTDDFNGGRPNGTGFFQVTQRHGRRSSAVDYLNRTAGGARVSVHLKSRVTRVLFEKGRASGVEVSRRPGIERMHARREVIVSAGIVRSPQLLMLSGIGPADGLRRLGIDVVVNSPGVGANVQDHLRIPVVSHLARRRPTRFDRLIRAAFEYLLSRRGLLASNTCDAGAIVLLGGSDEVPALRIVCQWRALPDERDTFVDFEVVLIDPRSKGRLWLTTRDPDGACAIDPGYLTDPWDAERLTKGVELARMIAASPACRKAGVGREIQPGDADMATHIRQRANTAYHAVGTCRLGRDALAVVDPYLQVVGVLGLRVVDASVMPTTVAGNAQAAVLAIAERAADLIRGR
jgi:choline dehydrogenase